MPSIYDSFLEGSEPTPDTTIYDSFLGTQEATPEPIVAPVEDLSIPEKAADWYVEEKSKPTTSFSDYVKTIGRGAKDFFLSDKQQTYQALAADENNPDREQALQSNLDIVSERQDIREKASKVPFGDLVSGIGQSLPLLPAAVNPVSRGTTAEGFVAKTAINTAGGTEIGYRSGITEEERQAGAIGGAAAGAVLPPIFGAVERGIGAGVARIASKPEIEAAEAMGSVPKGTAKMTAKAELNSLDNPQTEALAQVALGARNPTTLTEAQMVDKVDAATPRITTKEIDAQIKELSANTAAPGAKEKIAELWKQKQEINNPPSLAGKELSPEQFSTNIADPVANAIDSGVPVYKIKDELVANLLAANRKPEEIDDLVEAALAPYYELKVPYEALNEFKPTSIPTSGPPKNPTFLKGSDTPSKGKTLLTKEDVEAIVNSQGTKRTAEFVDDFTFQNRFSRQFSRKNDNIYGDLEINARDTTLNKISSVREVNNNVGTSWIDGDTKGHVYTMTNGIQRVDPSVKPLRKIYSDANELGLDAEQARILHKAANANSNWQRIDAEIAANNTVLQELKTKLRTATTDQERAVLNAQIKTATKDLNESTAKKTYMPREEVDKVMSNLAETEAGQQFLDDMKAWTDGVLDMRVRSGRMSKKEADAMKSVNKNYLPEMRDVEDYADLGIKISGTKDASKGIQTREFSEKELNVDPVESLVDYLFKTEHAALRTEERYHTLIHNLEHMDDGAFGVLFEQDKNKVIESLLKIKAGKADKIIDGRELVLNPDKNKIQATPNFSVFVDGHRLDLTVKNTEYLRALTRPRLYQEQTRLERYVVNPLAHVTRNSFTTWNPIFQPEATIRGMWGYKANMPKDLAGKRSEGTRVPFRQVASNLLKDKEYYRYLKANISPGVLNRGLHGKSTEQLINSTIQRINKPETKGIIAKPKQGVVYVKNNLEEWAEFNEMLVRGRAYEESKRTLLKQGMSAGDAERAAIRVAKNLETNYFSQGNAGTLYRFIQNGTPFLRTRINGALKTINSVRYRPKEVAGGIAAYMAILHGTNVYNRQYLDTDGTPLVDKLDPYIRENNFVVMLPGAKSVNDRVQVKSPFNIVRMGNAAEMAFDTTMKSLAGKIYDNVEPAVQKSMEANPITKQYLDEGKLTAQDVASIALDLTLKDFDPTAFTGLAGLGTLAEVAVNKDSFGNEIVPSYIKDLPSYQQINPTRATPLTIAVANALAEKGYKDVNPTIVAYVVQDTLGGIGAMMLAGGDIAYSALTGKEKPQSELKNIPGIGRFTGLGSEIPQTGVEKQYSATYKELAPAYKEFKKLEDQANNDSSYSDAYYKFYEDNFEAVMLYKQIYEPVQKELTKLYKELNTLTGVSGETLPSDSTPEKEFFGDPVRRENVDAVRKEIQFLQQSALDELYERRDVLGETWGKRLKVGTLPAAIRPVFLDNIEKPVDKPDKKEYNVGPQSNLETYDDSNPPSMTEQSGMDLQQADFQPSVYELFLEEGVDTFEPKGEAFKVAFPNIAKKFPEASKKVDDTYYKTVAKIESSNNPKAKSNNSSATGLYQFTKGTWSGLVKKYGKSHGLTEQGITSEQQQNKAIKLFTESNKKALANSLDIPESNIDHTALYAAHFLGVNGATKLLTASYDKRAASILPDAAKANKSIFYNSMGRPKTVKEVLNVIEKKMKDV